MNKAGFSQNGQLNVAVAGLGWWGKVIIEALKDNPKIRVVKTIDPVPVSYTHLDVYKRQCQHRGNQGR